MSEVAKMKIFDIIEESKKIDVPSIAEEILSWLENNVESYVDNKTKLYKIYLVVDSKEMSMTKKLQDLYGAIPDDDVEGTPMDGDKGTSDNKIKFLDECQECRRELDEIVKRVYTLMISRTQILERLFKRLIFFYEKIILNPENKKRAFEIDKELKDLIEGKENAPDKEKKKIQKQIVKLIQEGEGLVKYEELKGSVSITKFDYEAFSVGVKLSARPTDEEAEDGIEPEVMKDYVIPEGFVVWMELNYSLNQRPTSIF